MIPLLIFFASFTFSPSNDKIKQSTHLREGPKKKPTLPKRTTFPKTKNKL